MKKPNIKPITTKVVLYVKIAVLVVVLFTSLVGVYVIANADLRNTTIDFAQGSPKATEQLSAE